MDDDNKNDSNWVKNYGAVISETGHSPNKKLSLDKEKSTMQLSRNSNRILSLSIIVIFISSVYIFRRYNPPLTFHHDLHHELRTSPDHHPKPFSKLDPVSDIQLYPYDRPKDSRPGNVFGKFDRGQGYTKQPLPTNQWHQNLFLLDDGADPNWMNRVYTQPYVVDMVGPIPGLRLLDAKILAMDTIVQVTYVDFHGLTLGATHNLASASQDMPTNIVEQRYTLDDGDDSVPISSLGATLKWEPTNKKSTFQKMTSSIVRGMPYGTMSYQYNEALGSFKGVLPTVAADLFMGSSPVVDPETDSETHLICSNQNHEGSEEMVRKSVQLSFRGSDYTWLVFYSHPVFVRCYESITSGKERFSLQATRLAGHETNKDGLFISRIALMNNCTYGFNPDHCTGGKPHDSSKFSSLLHKHANVYPGPNSKIDFTFLSDGDETGRKDSYLHFDWDAKNFGSNDGSLLMYSLEHHRESFMSDPTISTTPGDNNPCVPTLSGTACLIEGSNWILKNNLAIQPSFLAPRPPMPEFIPNLARAVNEDIHFRIPENYRIGAGDTYFSGKYLAKLARVLLIAEELVNMCSEIHDEGSKVYKECNNVTLPSNEDFNEAINHLRSSTEIWINGTAEAPFVYDKHWGGVANCGCYFNGKTQRCDNVFPNCPAFSDRGLNFGHAFYNDHHFHQGYHIYAAAAVAHFDPSWGRSHFEEVLVLIRDIANPSTDDVYFPTFRMKDWYAGNSWAGGIAALYPNGRNQESSAEAIAAYEAVSLFGQVMIEAWKQDESISHASQKENISRACHIRDVGNVLTATELRSTERYWHVTKKDRVYPKVYSPAAVGILWNMMAQFQTWFGAAPYLAYGIQLIPLTPVSESRDNIDWAKGFYLSYAKSCRASKDCDAEGWGIPQHALLATAGHPDLAIEYAEKLPKEVFSSAGGNGHSLSNTIWYYATRPKTEPLQLGIEQNITLDCGCPDTCTASVLDSAAVGYTCGQRMKYLMGYDGGGKSEVEACTQVAGSEYTDLCYGCDPESCAPPPPEVPEAEAEESQCPKCSKTICEDEKLNRCPVLNAPYLCTDGPSKGGCSMVPWILEPGICKDCCELTYDCEHLI